jgi:hypothetical protein
MTAPLSPIPGPQISSKDQLTPVWRSWFNQLYQYISVSGATGGFLGASTPLSTTSPLTGGGLLSASLTLGIDQTAIKITESQVTGLTTDLAAKAALASPALTGTPTINGVSIRTGAGSPNGSVTGSPGDLYLNTSGGASTTLYVKESGTATNTGWVGK